MTLEAAETATWVREQVRAWKKRTNNAERPFSSIAPNYGAWIKALDVLRIEHGIDRPIINGQSAGAAQRLVEAGCPPEQIKAIFTMLFR